MTDSRRPIPAIHYAIWINVDGKDECIRYFSHGLKGVTPEAWIFFHGDELWVKDGVSSPLRGYDTTEEALLGQARASSSWGQYPFIYISRPGVFGSSGSHKQRRRLREVKVMREAVKRIIEMYSISQLNLSGQSGGGHIVASLLPALSNVKCAVITSGVTAVRKRIQIKGWDRDVTGYYGYYDPIMHVSEIDDAENILTVFIIGDPRDTVVPFASQKAYYEALKQSAINAVLIEESATDEKYHNLNLIATNPHLHCKD